MLIRYHILQKNLLSSIYEVTMSHFLNIIHENNLQIRNTILNELPLYVSCNILNYCWVNIKLVNNFFNTCLALSFKKSSFNCVRKQFLLLLHLKHSQVSTVNFWRSYDWHWTFLICCIDFLCCLLMSAYLIKFDVWL